MAKKIVEKKELTIEEKLSKEKEQGLSMIEREIPFLNKPTYFFVVGDKVRYGSLKESIVDEIFYDGKVYGLKCIAIANNYGKPYEYETYRVVNWTEVRPIESGDTDFAKNQNIKLYYNNSELHSLIHSYYSFGIDMNPDYQRGYVWGQEDKELIIDSIFNNIDIGKFVLIHLSNDEWSERGYSYEILDGKQRLNTIVEFYENRLQYNGKYFNELSRKDQRLFTNHTVAVANVDECDKKTILKYFLMLNRTGKSMSNEHLEKIEQMLESLK